MKAICTRFAVAAVLATTAASAAQAQAPVQAESGMPQAHHVLRIATGAKGKGFSRVFADIQYACGSRVALAEVPTEGGLQNLSVLVANRADLGFVQLDTLREMKASDDAIGKLRTVLPMNSNLLHVVARRDGYPRRGIVPLVWPLDNAWFNRHVHQVSDLRGLAVAVVGSARKLGRTVSEAHGLDIRFVDVETDDAGIAMVQRGEVAALFTTSGWPNGPVQALRRADGVKLVPFDLPVQRPYQKVRKNYDNVDAWNMEFLAAENVLVTRPFSGDGAKGRAVQALQACILHNLTQLQEGAFEPAWRDVRSPDEAGGDWPVFQAQAAGQAEGRTARERR
ncbi:hypothetical protein WG922_17740 [Ramlibacter sp. AN1015]|uniref:hypothetical protein n=1 Tax=Ramlibacter sp. AN1015 TaxID=3133428 RepID=UPI0030BEBB77